MYTDYLSGKKVLLIDDDLDFLRLTMMTFKETGAQVVTTPMVEEVIDKLVTHQPDLILLDAMMPGTDGFTLCKHIRRYAKTPLIMLSALDQDQLMLRGLEAGADDFLSKPINPEVLLARARAVIRRCETNGISDENPNYRDHRLEIDIKKHRVTICGRPIKLTPVEFRLLAYLLNNAGKVISYDQILFGVWTSVHKDGHGSIHVYISHLRNKIEEDPKKPTYIRSVHRVGYIFEKQAHLNKI
jgi:DNA-binding response OmpR family regulator